MERFKNSKLDLREFNLNHEELYIVLQRLHKNFFFAQMATADEVCYGGVESTRKAKLEENKYKEIYTAFPRRVWDLYEKLRVENEANKLRKKAEKLEEKLK